MKILLAAVNAKYIHSNPAVYGLKRYAEEYQKKNPVSDFPEIEIAEYTINQETDEILRSVFLKKPDLIAFSCYIWNMEAVEKLLLSLSQVLPDAALWLGGPEVSFDAPQILKAHPELTGIMIGEGEETFAQLCCERAMDNIPGIAYRRKNGEIRITPARRLLSMDDLPFPYADIDTFENRIIYYESSRGCPFSCSYCLSSVEKSVRFRDVETVKKELQIFLNKKVPQVKFVDRTFNCRHSHALGIWRYIKEHDNGVTNFHFEIAADLLNEEELALLETLRPGLVQLEIGVQSTNEKTLKEIERVSDFAHLSKIVRRLKQAHNMHLHLDLIAGLPYEDCDSFKKSFNDVYSLSPDQLQLGFLKVLKGSQMHRKAKKYHINYHRRPVYEVFSTDWISYKEILRLKSVEEMVEIYYNSGQFSNTIRILEEEFADPFSLYEALADFYEMIDSENKKYSRLARVEILRKFARNLFEGQAGQNEEERSLKKKRVEDLILVDLYLRENIKSRPKWARDLLPDKEETLQFYRREEENPDILLEYPGRSAKQMMHMTHLEWFSHLPGHEGEKIWLLFDYAQKDPLSQNARAVQIRME